MLQLDTSLTQAINAFAGRVAALDWIMLFLANAAVYLMVLAVAARWFWPSQRPHERHVAISCGLAAVLALGATQIIHMFYDRPRPYTAGVSHLLVSHGPDPSFPSDHATLVFAIAVMLLVKHHAWAKAFTVLACLVALSRVYVGVHYASDVIGGAAVGLIVACLVSRFYREGNALDRQLVKIL